MPVSSHTPRRSGRSIRALDMLVYLGEVFEVISETQIEDPTSYDEAVTEADSNLWQKTMKTEMESMYSN